MDSAAILNHSGSMAKEHKLTLITDLCQDMNALKWNLVDAHSEFWPLFFKVC